ncbi:site-specific integrase [Streptomyces erythrochromogenes]|uniref:hypothetical protein n=1 Tax=Streptomyces erythrochromogenes TaxID=285574 RepID=UPI0036FC8D04
MIAATDTTTLIGAHDAATFTTGFALAARSSEAALLNHEHEPTGLMFLRIDRHGRINPPMQRAGLAARPGDVLPDGAPRWTGHSSPRLRPRPPATPRRTPSGLPATAAGPTDPASSPAATTAPPPSTRN